MEKENVVVEKERRHVVVVVLGDIGRSPRMQYHALSVLQHGHNVSLVGYYSGDGLFPDLKVYHDDDQDDPTNSSSQRQNSLCIIPLNPFIDPRRHRPTQKPLLPFYFIARALSLICSLFWGLLQCRKDVHVVLVQNPPSIPTLLVAYLYTRFKNAKFMIDWHNLGFSMLENKHLQSLVRLYERVMAPTADAHFCVTHAMKAWLKQHFHIHAHTLYDGPPHFFRPIESQEMKESTLKELIQKYPSQLQNFQIDNKEQQTKSLPKFIISSTSWTPDEDFGILLDALCLLDPKLTLLDDNHPHTRLVVVVTGKGPQKEYYQNKIKDLSLQNIEISTIWLDAQDYPKLLACADLGVSLHTSTSKLDLPMKIWDMLGCAIPVCAVHYDCLKEELFSKEARGHTFTNHQILSQQIYDLLFSKSTNCENDQISKMKLALTSTAKPDRWSTNWDTYAKPIILSTLSTKKLVKGKKDD